MCSSILRGVLLLLLFLSTRAAAQSVIHSLSGMGGDKLGAAIVDAGDVNNDGWHDYLVGAPNAGGGRGAAYYVSGNYLATGNGAAILYTVLPDPNMVSASAHFGFSITDIGDITGDGVHEFAIGAPDHSEGAMLELGCLFVLDGGSHSLLPPRWVGPSAGAHFAWSVSVHEGPVQRTILVGAPGDGVASQVCYQFFLGSSCTTYALHVYFADISWAYGSQFGTCVLGTVDLTGDGIGEIIVTGPGAAQFSGGDQSVLRIYNGAATSGGSELLAEYWGQYGNRLGRSLSSGHDIDGDGVPDLLAGAFNTDGGGPGGKAVLLSGQPVLAQTGSAEIFTWLGSTNYLGAPWDFGASVAITSDLNGDSIADLLVGAPNLATSQITKGAVWVYSGASGAQMGWVGGGLFERIGSALLGAEEIDHDGYNDFLVGATESDTPATDCGTLRAMRLFPAGPTAYCTGKQNSAGCQPWITWAGNASLTSGGPCPIGAYNIVNQKSGIFFYGYAPNSAPFQGGALCVLPPTIRTPLQNSGGSASGTDCSGTYDFDFNAYMQSGADPQLAVGVQVFGQYWYRDPPSASTTGLTNAIAFVVNP